MLRDWFKGIRKSCCIGSCVALAVFGSAASARAGDNDAELRQLLEQQAKQIQELKDRLDQNQATKQQEVAAEGDAAPAPANDEAKVRKIVGDYLKEQKASEASAKATKLETEGFKVGSDLTMSGRWTDGRGLVFATPNNDFNIHIGGQLQYDTVWFKQNQNFRAGATTLPHTAGNPAFSGGSNSLTDWQDGNFFRRVRPQVDGTFYEIFEFAFFPALERVEDGVVDIDEMWVGVQKIPWLGTARVGHIHLPHGLEGDAYSSSKAMSFLERSLPSQAFGYDNLATGLLVTNSFFNQHMTYAGFAGHEDNDNQGNGNNAVNFSDGSYTYVARLTGLPIWENDGRCFLHVGASATYRKNPKPDGAGNVTTGVVPVQGGTVGSPVARFRSRPELQDFQGDYGTAIQNNLPATIGLPGNNQRLVDTGNFACPATVQFAPELLFVYGPFSMQAEYYWVNATDVPIPAIAGAGGHPAFRSDEWFDGGYIQLSYFLTGENRTYDRRLGRLGSDYIARPFTRFFAVNGENGPALGWGAWELAARFSYLNLDAADVHGGKMEALELGVNWYLTTNFKFQFMYNHNERFNLPGNLVPGAVDGFGIRTQLFF